MQPVDGLSYMGVTFGFTVGGSPSTDALYNSIGPGSITYLQGRLLEGNAAGTLTLDFDPLPTDQLQFGIALSTRSAATPGYTVELFDTSLASLGTISRDTYPLMLYSEDQFTYSGAPVRRAVIGFNGQVADRFALDNLTFDPATIPSAPAPSAILLGSIGAGFVGWLRRNRTM